MKKKISRDQKKILLAGALVATAAITVLGSCRSIPKNAQAVSAFDMEKYLGKWYEIARMDFRFERNLEKTTAEYSMNKDGSIRVVNRGYNTKTKKWEVATGKAKFRAGTHVAALKVSFFGPFYSGYNVVALEGDYQYALVAGKNLNYLWILSRKQTIPDDVKKEFLRKAKIIGYDIEELIWPEQG